MTTSERIAAAIKSILDEDRRADRERIAELERDFARALVREREANERTGAAIHRVQSLENGAEWERKDVSATIDGLNKQLDELNEKCVALVVERDAAKNFWFTVSTDKAPSMRIDTDMSDPQPGKLLVVRLDGDDVGRSWVTPSSGRCTQNFWPEQRVGFLVETPAVKQEEQGPWVICTSTSRFESRDEHRLSSAPDGARIFGTKEEAQEHIDANCQGWASFQYPLSVITLAEARGIEAKR